MKVLARPLLVSVLLALVACASGDEYELKVYPAQQVNETIRIDGALDESAWQNAAMATNFTFYNEPTLVDAQTYFRATFDTSNLFLAVECDEPLIDQVKPGRYALDSTDLFGGKVIEIFADPDHDHSKYFQIAVDSSGNVYDSMGQNPSWNSGAQAKGMKGTNRWQLEVSIPWKPLGVQPQAGVLIGLNICRDRNVANAKQWTNWSQTTKGFHDPLYFGHLVLSPSRERLAALEKEVRKGGRQGPLVIYSKEGVSSRTYAAMLKQSLSDVQTLTQELLDLARQLEDAPMKQEMQKVLGEAKEKLQPLQQSVEETGEIQAQDWTRINFDLTKVKSSLEKILWKARLSALLTQL